MSFHVDRMYGTVLGTLVYLNFACSTDTPMGLWRRGLFKFSPSFFREYMISPSMQTELLFTSPDSHAIYRFM